MSLDADYSELFPGFSEKWFGYYNVPEEQAKGSQKDRVLCYHQQVRNSQADIPELTDREYVELKRQISSCLSEAIAGPGSPMQHLLYGRFFVIDHFVDRTITIELGATPMTSDMLRAVQSLLVQQHPLWRVVFTSWYAPNTTIVYPAVIRLFSEDGTLDDRVDWRNRVDFAIQRERNRFSDLQWSIVESRLPDAIRQSSKNEPVVVACFDFGSYVGPVDSTFYVVWYLENRECFINSGRRKDRSASEYEGFECKELDEFGRLAMRSKAMETFPFYLTAIGVKKRNCPNKVTVQLFDGDPTTQLDPVLFQIDLSNVITFESLTR